jgi:hypothetical protein
VTNPEEFPFESPVGPTRQMFIELNEAMEEAMRAGFTRTEAFDLIKMMHEVSWNATYYRAATGSEDE